MTKKQKSNRKNGRITDYQNNTSVEKIKPIKNPKNSRHTIPLLEFVRRAVLKKYRSARAASLLARNKRDEEMEHVTAVAYKNVLKIIKDLKEWERKR